eukprot:10330405-Alexandrium_andersonii.AAC.1
MVPSRPALRQLASLPFPPLAPHCFSGPMVPSRPPVIRPRVRWRHLPRPGARARGSPPSAKLPTRHGLFRASRPRARTHARARAGAPTRARRTLLLRAGELHQPPEGGQPHEE